MDTTSLIVTALLLIAIVTTGIWVSRLGKPIRVVPSTVHKLVALGTGIYLLVTLVRQGREVPLGAGGWTAAAVTALGFAALAATGGLLASGRTLPAAVLRVHQAVPAVTIAAAIAMGVVLGG